MIHVGPTNSLGQPWSPEQRWECIHCKLSGPDRHDAVIPLCPLTADGVHLPLWIPRSHHDRIIEKYAKGMH